MEVEYDGYKALQVLFGIVQFFLDQTNNLDRKAFQGNENGGLDHYILQIYILFTMGAVDGEDSR